MAEPDIKIQFLEAYDAHADAIFRHCFFRVFSRQRAEELAQETFMKTWQYLQQGKKVENMRAFLYRVAGNLVIDESRKKKEASLDALLDNEESSFEPSNNDHKVIERNALFRQMMKKIKKLPEDERDLILMRYVDDLDPKDIAELTGLSANNVSVKIHRSIQILKERV